MTLHGRGISGGGKKSRKKPTYSMGGRPLIGGKRSRKKGKVSKKKSKKKK